MTDSPKEQVLHDSGERREFDSGAVRDRGDLKPRPDLISPHAMMREGMINTLGSLKYSERNWEKGMPISVCLASAQRHIEQYKRGDTDEDHLAQARWNLGAMIHFEEEIKAGRLDPVLNDMPKYTAQDRKYACPKCGHAPLTPFVCETGTELGCDGCHNWTTLDEPGASSPCPGCGMVIPQRPGELSCLHCGVVLPQKEVPEFVADAKAATPRQEAQDCVRRIRTNGVLAGASRGIHYIAGPMRGYKHFNFPAFDTAEQDAHSKGLSVISPAQMDRANGIDPVNYPESAIMAETNSLNEIVTRDCEMLVALSADNGDGMILLTGWEKSTGARAEVAIGLWLKLQFRLADDLNILVNPDDIIYRLFSQQEGSL